MKRKFYTCLILLVAGSIAHAQQAKSNTYTEVPMIITQTGNIAVQAKINGTRTEYLLVETAGRSFLRTDYPERLDAMNINKETKYPKINIQIGNYSIAGAKFSLNKSLDEKAGEMLPETIMGTLGPNGFSKGIWQFDFKAKKIRITKNLSDLDIPANTPKTRFRTSFANRACNVIIHDKNFGEQELILDTHSSLGFHINRSFIPTRIWGGYADGMDKAVITYDGYHATEVYSRDFTDLTVENDMLIKAGKFYFSKVLSNSIGLGFLKDFVVTVDYIHNVLYLEPIDSEIAKKIE